MAMKLMVRTMVGPRMMPGNNSTNGLRLKRQRRRPRKLSLMKIRSTRQPRKRKSFSRSNLLLRSSNNLGKKPLQRKLLRLKRPLKNLNQLPSQLLPNRSPRRKSQRPRSNKPERLSRKNSLRIRLIRLMIMASNTLRTMLTPLLMRLIGTLILDSPLKKLVN